MRRASVVLLLLLALTGCGDAESSEVARNGDVPGTRPSTATPTLSSAPAPTPSSVEESLTPSSAPSEPVSTEVVEATPETLAGYRALSTGLGAFFTAAQRMDKELPDADPQSAEEVDDLIGDVYPDGVDLAVFDVADPGLTLCMTGPATTFLLLASDDELMRQVLGVGDCADPETVVRKTDGDVVVDLTIDVSGGGARYVATVLKGQNLADQIEDLDGWIGVINEAMAR